MNIWTVVGTRGVVRVGDKLARLRRAVRSERSDVRIVRFCGITTPESEKPIEGLKGLLSENGLTLEDAATVIGISPRVMDNRAKKGRLVGLEARALREAIIALGRARRLHLSAQQSDVEME